MTEKQEILFSEHTLVDDDIFDKLSKSAADTLDKMAMDTLTRGTNIWTYKKTRVPRYLYIWLPHLELHHCYDYEYGDMGLEGLLFSFRKIRLFKIGTKIEQTPVMKKYTGEIIKFRRYGDLKVTGRADL